MPSRLPRLPAALPDGSPDRETLRAWTDQSLRGIQSEGTVLMELVRAGLTLDEAGEMIKLVKGGRAGESWLGTRETDRRMSTDRRSPWPSLAVGLACLIVGIAGWVSSRGVAGTRGGVYYVPVGLLIYGVFGTAIGVSRLIRRRDKQG